MDLRTRAIRSTAWYASTRLWMQAVSWAVTIVVARLLAPEEYGLFGMAAAVIGFLELFQELGLGAAIVQRSDMTAQEINAVFWVVFGASLTLTTLTFLGSGVAAWLYGEPRVALLLRVLAFTFLLSSLGTVPYSLLTKAIDFRRRSLGEAFGVLASAAVTPGLAYLGYGVWALVMGYLARTAVRNLAMWLFCGWTPGLDASFSRIKEVMKFGLHVTGAMVSKLFSGVANTVIIGRFLGGNGLGLYTMANTLANDSINKISTSIISELSFPVFSNLQNNVDELRKYFMKITKYLVVVSFPAQIGLAILADDFVRVLLSDKWLPVVGMLQAFCVAGLFYVLPLSSGPLLNARGRADTSFKVSAVSALSLSIALLIGVQFGIKGLITGWLVAFPLPRMYLLRESLRELDLGMGQLLKGIAPSLLATAAMAIVVLLLPMAAFGDPGAVGRLVLKVSTGAAVYVATLLLLDSEFGTEVKTVVQAVLAPSPT